MLRVEHLIEVRQQLSERYRGEVMLKPDEVVVSSQEAAFLEQVRAVVEQHLSDANFTVDRLAEEVGLSPRQLQRRLREAAKLSPAGFVRMMRLERAAQLLGQEAGRVSEVAYAVGFKNAQHFSRLFRQVFGVAPSEFTA